MGCCLSPQTQSGDGDGRTPPANPDSSSSPTKGSHGLSNGNTTTDSDVTAKPAQPVPVVVQSPPVAPSPPTTTSPSAKSGSREAGSREGSPVATKAWDAGITNGGGGDTAATQPDQLDRVEDFPREESPDLADQNGTTGESGQDATEKGGNAGSDAKGKPKPDDDELVADPDDPPVRPKPVQEAFGNWDEGRGRKKNKGQNDVAEFTPDPPPGGIDELTPVMAVETADDADRPGDELVHAKPKAEEEVKSEEEATGKIGADGAVEEKKEEAREEEGDPESPPKPPAPARQAW
eukprot:Hpha_TRINITY_DN16370_c4_g3::TRINITY_DN16370_c4_g3_i1::g.62434::m.62434